MKLTDTGIRAAKPKAKPYKLPREDGLFLLINPSGSKWWRLAYSFDGKEKLLSLGVYPEVSLADARRRRDEARKLLAAGVDPSGHRKAEKLAGAERAANSFEVIAREWFGKFSTRWAPSHSSKTIGRLERDVFPWLGDRAVASVTAPELLTVLRRVEARGALETAHRILQVSGQIFRYAIATGRAERDPSQDLRGALAPWKPEHYPSITEPKAIGGLLRAIDGFSGTFPVACALKLAPMLFVRPGELRQMEWAEVDLDSAEWSIPAGKMKTREPHLVPLPTQAIAILRELQPFSGRGQFVFPGVRSPRKPMSDAALNAALRRLGYPKEVMTLHGFRATARTLLDETLGFRPDFIEHQLAHAVRDPNGRAYNRTSHLPERRKMMQAWADYLDTLTAPAAVLPLRAA
ncbi:MULTISPECIES: tyrosine-type recombinase/integrase [Hydrocarboniphaga]|uniref:Phage integrase n=1 Tax=Hydrocarboniphaga effusa AP103 TaxID=1172194 RepID=I7ZE77_9GAMM|nr:MULTISPECIES: integrase arm-type DNA-binding domain-containing protein [Hydrocarboniphaga]EIT69977.1 Phage integrase [Hydrocarboniphaga effusa AP103]EIT70164.1 Phage integrase [Hydrocarboniphaga effusa AP103]MDZ4077207.1 integrase arm-type DNA-binding domain-containing protein [Hydrocarboniphaga sp.]